MPSWNRKGEKWNRNQGVAVSEAFDMLCIALRAAGWTQERFDEMIADFDRGIEILTEAKVIRDG